MSMAVVVGLTLFGDDHLIIQSMRRRKVIGAYLRSSMNSHNFKIYEIATIKTESFPSSLFKTIYSSILSITY